MNIPHRLSDQQKFILATLAEVEAYREEDDLSRTVLGTEHPESSRLTWLSWKVAREFNDGHKDRIWGSEGQIEANREAMFEEVAEVKARYEDEAKEEMWNEIEAIRKKYESFKTLIQRGGGKDETLTSKHSASFSRAVARLEERGLVVRLKERRHRDRQLRGTFTRETEGNRRVALTERGREIGDELLRRHDDGRYSLEFETV